MDDDSFSLTETHTVDHTGDPLGVAWVPNDARGAAVTETVSTEVFTTGRKRNAASWIARCIDDAAETVVVSTFLFADKALEEALLRAAARGVRVYALMAASTRLDREPRDDAEFDLRVRDEHKAMLRRVAGHVLVRSAEDFHAKFVLVDPTGARPCGWLLTANLTSEALERNEELVIELSRDEVDRAFAWARHAFWARATHELLDAQQLAPCTPLPEAAVPPADGAVVVTCGATCAVRDAALDVIRGAGKRLVVASFGWQLDHPVVQALLARVRAGLSLTILARVRPSAMPALLALREVGATVLGFKWLHAKAIWGDQGEALVASANLERHGLDQGFEVGARLSGARAEAVGRALDAWAAVAAHRLETSVTVGAVTGEVQAWRGGSLQPVVVEPSRELALRTETAPCVTLRGTLAPPTVEAPSNGKRFHRTVLRRTIESPVLSPKAVSLELPATPEPPYPVYREPSGRVVAVVERPNEAELALSLLKAHGVEAVVRRR